MTGQDLNGSQKDKAKGKSRSCLTFLGTCSCSASTFTKISNGPELSESLKFSKRLEKDSRKCEPQNSSQYLINRNKSRTSQNKGLQVSKGVKCRGQKVPARDEWLAAEIAKQGPHKKLERYETARLSNENVLTILQESNSSMKRYQEKISDCGSWLVLRHYTQIDETRVIKANFCKKHLLCNLCALRRSALQVQTFEKTSIRDGSRF